MYEHRKLTIFGIGLYSRVWCLQHFLEPHGPSPIFKTIRCDGHSIFAIYNNKKLRNIFARTAAFVTTSSFKIVEIELGHLGCRFGFL